MMSRFFALALFCGCFLFAQSSDLDKAFQEFQQAWNTSDKSAAAKLISEDVTWFSVRGRSLTRQEVLDTMTRRGGMDMVRDEKVRTYGSVAIITITDGAAGSDTRRTVVWNKMSDGWRIVAFHASMTPQ